MAEHGAPAFLGSAVQPGSHCDARATVLNGTAKQLLCAAALVAQLDRASDFESEGREFESLRARQENKVFLAFFGLSFFPKIELGKQIGSKVSEHCKDYPITTGGMESFSVKDAVQLAKQMIDGGGMQ
jgi:hypothetical protein